MLNPNGWSWLALYGSRIQCGPAFILQLFAVAFLTTAMISIYLLSYGWTRGIDGTGPILIFFVVTMLVSLAGFFIVIYITLREWEFHQHIKRLSRGR